MTKEATIQRSTGVMSTKYITYNLSKM